MQDHLYLVFFSVTCVILFIWSEKSKRMSVYIMKELPALGYYYIIFLFVHAKCLVIFLISCNLIGCSSGRLFTISWLWSKSVIFWRMARSEKLSFEHKNHRKIWNITQWILNNPIWLHVESVPCRKGSKTKYFLDINTEKQCNFYILSSNASQIFSNISKNIRSNLQIFPHTTLPGTWKV